ncbi:hypothetical protein BB558_003666 [Smittium angustum]|uniref:glutamine--tRNA ligase n=1 Tax=Smittium angustum TaxID=133377 RepID=A0A2U1J5C5_SMIAN|nr:hypothetical protein BB558_003666 [Smittium angustum]
MSDSTIQDLCTQFECLGLSKEKALETAKNQKLATSLIDIIAPAKLESNDFSKSVGSQLYNLASTISPEAKLFKDFLAQEIAKENLSTNDQVSEAIKFCKSKNPIENYQEFKLATGMGIIVDDSTISSKINNFLTSNTEKLQKDRYRILGMLLSKIRQDPELRWAKAEKIKNELEKQVLQLIGPKDERDVPTKGKGKKPSKPSEKPKSTTEKPQKTSEYIPASLENMFAEGDISRLHKAGENPQIDPEIMKKHLEITKGQVITRFPPEPNGYLHIGHAKAINVNFGYAKTHGGRCNLRYDDTNPEAEEEKYITSILETVKWLGFEPSKILYASDYFKELHSMAVRLIERGLGYVCHCTGDEIYQQRGGESMGPRTACVHRERPIAESLEEFKKMKDGRYAAGEAILRMKMDLEDGNPQMWDLVAYRVMYATHHRTGNDWCIYPTYDFAHCLCDSIENITHSLCTTEFTQSRKSYYWLCDAVEVYKPVQWEYGRLNVTNTILSKRKLLKLIESGNVSALDDPRLYTLPALRRRGVPAAAINGFVRELGVTTAKTNIEVGRLESHIRDCLNSIAPRLMAVLNPIKVRLTNFSGTLNFEVPFKPRDPTFGVHTVPFTDTLYIDASDFRTVDSKDYYRLAPGKTVGLLYAPFPITCTEVVHDENGNISELLCRYEDGSDGKPTPKPKTFIQWISDCPSRGSPIMLNEVRIYNGLFLHPNPYDKTVVPGGWLSDINPNSLEVVKNVMVESGLYNLIHKFATDVGSKDKFANGNFEELRFQFLRTGYFCIDKDSIIPNEFIELSHKLTSEAVSENATAIPSTTSLIFNRIVNLKEDPNK